MIETFNNIIFYIGYFAISGIGLFIGVVAYAKSYELLMNKKRFFKYVFNSALNNSLEKTNEENFEKWLENIKQRYENIHKEK